MKPIAVCRFAQHVVALRDVRRIVKQRPAIAAQISREDEFARVEPKLDDCRPNDVARVDKAESAAPDVGADRIVVDLAKEAAYFRDVVLREQRRLVQVALRVLERALCFFFLQVCCIAQDEYPDIVQYPDADQRTGSALDGNRL